MKNLYLTFLAIIIAFVANGQTITGTTSVCLGGMETLSGSPAGGTWSSSNTLVAPVYGGGVYWGFGVGTATITYTTGTGYATTIVTVNSTVAPITGADMVCMGATTTLACATPGGLWSSANASVAIVGSGSGVVMGTYGPGTTTISYTLPSGCASIHFITVNPTPAAITGPDAICLGTAGTMSSATSGGMWTNDAPAIVTIGMFTGLATGVGVGTTTITYTAGSGCYSTKLVTVSAVPPGITGSTTVCVGSTGTLSCTAGGGTWASAVPGVATIGLSTGIATGVTVGTTVVTYTLAPGCNSTRILTVTATPAAITGLSSVCVGASLPLSCASTGGTWMSSDPTVASVGVTTGVVTGNSAGTTNISYTLGTGCSSVMSFTVYPNPTAITGPSTVCSFSTMTLSSTPAGGMWMSSSPTTGSAMATTGLITGGVPGTTTITYTLPASGCYTTATITVNPLPAAITGPSTVCVGSTISLACSTTGGIWTTSDLTIAPVDAGGVVTGGGAGTVTISYTLPTGCSNAKLITVNALPAAITGPSTMCEATVTTLDCATIGGTWSSTPTGFFSPLGSSVIVSGLPAGTATVSYATGIGCFSTHMISVSPSPTITGTATLCVGGTTILTPGIAGGTWSSASPTITVGATTGLVSATAAGTATITYTLSTGCYGTIVVTASAVPAISVSSAPSSCGPLYTATATGATTYSWAPTTGIASGASSDIAYIYADAATTYTVTGTTAGCSGTGTVMISANRILGHLSFSGPTPSGTAAKVWLVQFNTADSSIIATDSMNTCLDGGAPYFEFTGKPVGVYLVKAKLLSSVAGTSDYIPTYGASAATWDIASDVIHATASDSMHIDMLYGTVPSGPGFISGYVYMGAGKGTSGEVPVANMIVYLKNASGTVLTYTYTDASGAYSFGSLGYGSYVIYPEEMSYYTTPSSVITLSGSTPSAGGIGFKKRTTMGTIEPWTLPDAVLPITATVVEINPNPANDMVVITNAQGMEVRISDLTGREVYSVNITSDRQSINIANLPNGIYVLTAGNAKSTVLRSRLIKQ